MKIQFSNHSLKQMEIRGISIEMANSILAFPDQIENQDNSIHVYTKLIHVDSKIYLYRAFVNIEKEPNVLVTIYKTSKIEKYGHSIR
jgi:hypothetical protein